MKKVLFVTNTMGRAGAERCLINLLDCFDKEQYELSLFSIIPQGSFFNSIPEGVKILNESYSCEAITSRRSLLTILFMIFRALLIHLNFIRYLPYALKNVYYQLKRGRFSWDKLFWRLLSWYAPPNLQQYDLAVAYLEGGATYYTADRICAKKKVCFVHIDYEKSGYCNQLDAPYYGKFEKIYCVSGTVKKSMESNFPQYASRMETFQNIISDTYIKQAARRGDGFSDDFDGIRVLTIGRLHYQKAYDVAIPALAAILARNTSLKLRWYVLGEGGERPRLERLIKRYGLENHFFLLGAKSNPYPFLQQCDIYVHATRFEGWSIAIAEAKILAKPIIASNCAGVDEQLTPENAVIINLSVSAIADALEQLAMDAERRAVLADAVGGYWARPSDVGKLYALLQ